MSLHHFTGTLAASDHWKIIGYDAELRSRLAASPQLSLSDHAHSALLPISYKHFSLVAADQWQLKEWSSVQGNLGYSRASSLSARNSRRAPGRFPTYLPAMPTIPCYGLRKLPFRYWLTREDSGLGTYVGLNGSVTQILALPQLHITP